MSLRFLCLLSKSTIQIVFREKHTASHSSLTFPLSDVFNYTYTTRQGLRKSKKLYFQQRLHQTCELNVYNAHFCSKKSGAHSTKVKSHIKLDTPCRKQMLKLNETSNIGTVNPHYRVWCTETNGANSRVKLLAAAGRAHKKSC